jgi:hypothetical protein
MRFINEVEWFFLVALYMTDVLTMGLARVVFQAWRLNGCMVGGHDGILGLEGYSKIGMVVDG